MVDSQKLVWALTSLNMCLYPHNICVTDSAYVFTLLGSVFDEFASLKIELSEVYMLTNETQLSKKQIHQKHCQAM